MSSHTISRAVPALHVSALLLSLTLGLAACGGGGGGGGGEGGTAAAPIQAAAITTQPAPQSVAEGAAATFSVQATGTGLSYQWRRDGKDIAGATAASYTLNNAGPADDRAVFTVEVRNSAGSVVSTGAALQVVPPKGLSLLAGRPGGPGNLDGRDGRFTNVIATAVAPDGLLYVVDSVGEGSGPGTLRTVDPATGVTATVHAYAWDTVPAVIRFDGAGNRYELTTSSIFKTTPAGARSLLAGSGVIIDDMYTAVDGVGAAARFGRPTDMAIDGAGNLYVADMGARTIRKVDAAGKVVTLAGTGSSGHADGPGNRATFAFPLRITVDGAGNVFVVDIDLARGAAILRKVGPDGRVTTLPLKAGANAVTTFGDYGNALAAGPAGELYVTSSWRGCRVSRIGPDGTVTDLAGGATTGFADGKGTAARFCSAQRTRMNGSLSIDRAGNLIVPDSGNHAIRRMTPAGEVTTIAGRPASTANQDGRGAAAAFVYAKGPVPPLDMSTHGYSLDADAQGNLYVGAGDRLRKVTVAGDVATLPRPVEAPGTRYFAGGLAYGRDAIVVSGNVISRMDANGVLRFLAGKAESTSQGDGTGAGASFARPSDLIMDGLGNVYLHDRIDAGPDVTSVMERKIGPDGTVSTIMRSEFFHPITAWHADKDGNLLVAYLGGSVMLIDPTGKSRLIRTASSDGSIEPTALTRDAAGNLYLATRESVNPAVGNKSGNLVRKIAPDGTETILAGTPGSSGVRLGSPGSLARVDALAVGSDGVLYLMTENAVLRLKQ